MELTKKELGQFLELLDNRNSLMKYGVEYVRGVNNLIPHPPNNASHHQQSKVYLYLSTPWQHQRDSHPTLLFWTYATIPVVI